VTGGFADRVTGVVADLTEHGPSDLRERVRELGARRGEADDRLASASSRLLFRADRSDLLERHELPFPGYDIRRDLAKNEAGPSQADPAVERPRVLGRS
jgi:hypothetical protein